MGRHAGQGNKGPRQAVLQACHVGRLAADTGRAGATRAAHGLFTLKAKHLIHNHSIPPCDDPTFVLGKFPQE